MTKVTITEEKPVSMAEVKEDLSKIMKAKGELNFRANKTFDYLNEFSKNSLQKTKELITKIEGLKIPRLKDEHIIKIVDTLPKYPEEVKALLSGYTITLSQESAKKIADVVKDFA